jgi:hypothetical protein
MKTYTIKEMKTILADHLKWLRGEGGSRADLSDADLSDADLSRADLRSAVLNRAVLRDADLRDADLSRAVLRGADLRSAVLNRAVLRDADLSDADLSRADLSRADLSGVKYLPAFQICEGDLIVYKKVAGKIVTLAIPKDAKRTASIVGRKCRAEYAMVLEIEGHESVTSNGCGNGISTTYEEGKKVRPDSYDDDFRIECSHGIHFFLTRKEAEEWQS